MQEPYQTMLLWLFCIGVLVAAALILHDHHVF
jgi:hypothetical protein